MNTCRRMPNTKSEGVYVTLKDGLSLKLDNHQSNLFKVGNFPEWLVFTQASGTSNGQGLIRMSCSINSEWIDHKLHLLKETDLDQLCGLKSQSKSPEVQKLGSKRPAAESVQALEAEAAKEEKIAMLKQRYLKR